jgi:hypothetical protein
MTKHNRMMIYGPKGDPQYYPLIPHSRNYGLTEKQMRLLWPILQRWPAGYRLGEYIQAVAVEQDRVRLPPQAKDTVGYLPPWQQILRPVKVSARSKEMAAT